MTFGTSSAADVRLRRRALVASGFLVARGISDVSVNLRSSLMLGSGAVATGERIEPLCGGRRWPEVEPFDGVMVRRQVEPCGGLDTVVGPGGW